MKIAAVMMVRNEEDILELNILHHLSAGVDFFLVVDNGSSDGTGAVLNRLSRTGRVHWTCDTGPYWQSEITSALAHEAFLRGADWVMAIDADEFWHAPQGDLPKVLEQTTAGALQAEVINFVQRHEQIDPSPDGLLHITRRVAVPVGPIELVPSLVEAGKISYIEMGYPSKWISRASLAIEIINGNTTVRHVAGLLEPTDRIICLHAPLRARSILASKCIDYARRYTELTQEFQDINWHIKRWRHFTTDEMIDKEWRANSYADGHLDIGGIFHPVVSDTRLRDLVTPWIQQVTSSDYGWLRHRSSSRPSLPLDQAIGSAADARGRITLMLDHVASSDGTLRDDEARLLMTVATCALTEHEPAIAVGIGTCGRGTAILRMVAEFLGAERRLCLFDGRAAEMLKVVWSTQSTVPLPSQGTGQFEIVSVHPSEPGITTEVSTNWQEPISFLYLDGSRDVNAIDRVFDHFSRRILPGAYITVASDEQSDPIIMPFIDDRLNLDEYLLVARVHNLIAIKKNCRKP